MKNKNEKEDKTYYLPIFMSIGLSVGVAIGAATNNMPICMCIGLAIGVGIGTALDSQKKNKNKEEWELDKFQFGKIVIKYDGNELAQRTLFTYG